MPDQHFIAAPPPFIHLRVHSAYSLAEGTFRIKDLVSRVEELGQPAVAVTDSGNLFAALEFSTLAAEAGIQPIIGVQMMLAEEQQGIDHQPETAAHTGEVVLLVQNTAGWTNLSRLVSAALLESEGEAAIAVSALKENGDGLILLSGGTRRGFVGAAAAAGQEALARSRLEKLAEALPGRVYVELQRHGLASQQQAEPVLLRLAEELGLPLVATNDSYFAASHQADAHDVLLCISAGMTISQEDRRRETDQHYLKSNAEMHELFADIPEALSNSLVIAQRCAFRVAEMKPILPAFPSEDGMDEAASLRRMTATGLEQRLAEHVFNNASENPLDEGAHAAIRKEYKERLEHELEIIISMGFAGYFLIVAEFIGWARGRGIPVGPGRGSGAGSLVAWVLGITDLDPIRWGLLFERFLNPERISMPDFDIDFCQERRDEVIQHVQERYGHDRVAQIITFGSLQARAALRDVGRVLEMPYGQVDRIAKLIPQNPANPVTISRALAEEEELRRQQKSDEQVAMLINIAGQLEGLLRHASTHAAGLVIGDRALPELVPLYRDPRSSMPVTQFNMKWVEKAGLVKFDFLGLKTLTVLQYTLNLLATNGIMLRLEDIPLADDKAFRMLGRGDTVGLFQLESSGMRDVLRGLKPDRFEDIIAVVALYRPGPMENIPKYVARKHGREEVSYPHPWLEPVLKETYGIMIYQEQVQQAAQRLAGYTLGAADILRRAMGKKIKAEMDAQRETFVNGAAANDIDSTLASSIFDQISAFAGYGFNKSHAAAYALIAWQTTWLKAHHPAAFLAASMTLDAANTEKLATFRQDCLAHDVAVLPPCINHSEARFSICSSDDGKQAIRYALGAIRNVGMEVMRQLVEEREQNGIFESLEDFAARMPKGCSRRILENLIRSGALDCLNSNRARLFNGMDAILGHAEAVRAEAETDQTSLFGGVEETRLRIILPECPENAPKQKLAEEFSALGLHLSAHPLDDYADHLSALGVVSSSRLEEELAARGDGSRLTLAGVVSSRQIRTSARGNRFAFVQFTDQLGGFEVTLFADVLAQCRDLLDSDLPLLVTADGRREEAGARLLAVRLQPLDEAVAERSHSMAVHVSDPAALDGIAEALTRDGRGRGSLTLIMLAKDKQVTVEIPGKHRLSGGFRQMVKALPGVSAVTESL